MKQRYPIGEFHYPKEIQESDIRAWIDEISALPELLKSVVLSLNEVDFEKTYRDGSWTIRQLVHHIADSHLNGYIRMKLALTEENPLVKTYEESEWAKLVDYNSPLNVSVQLIESLHSRWTSLLRNLTATQLKRTYQYPNSSRVRLEQSIALYAWHGNHHLAHIKQALNRM